MSKYVLYVYVPESESNSKIKKDFWEPYINALVNDILEIQKEFANPKVSIVYTINNYVCNIGTYLSEMLHAKAFQSHVFSAKKDGKNYDEAFAETENLGKDSDISVFLVQKEYAANLPIHYSFKKFNKRLISYSINPMGSWIIDNINQTMYPIDHMAKGDISVNKEAV